MPALAKGRLEHHSLQQEQGGMLRQPRRRPDAAAGSDSTRQPSQGNDPPMGTASAAAGEVSPAHWHAPIPAAQCGQGHGLVPREYWRGAPSTRSGNVPVAWGAGSGQCGGQSTSGAVASLKKNSS